MLTRLAGAGSGLALALLVLLGGVAPPHAAAADEVRVDDANHFDARIPPGWYPIAPSVVEAMEQEVLRRVSVGNFRYVAGYTTSPRGELTYPYVILQITDAPMDQVTEAEFVGGFDAKDLGDDVMAATDLADIMSDVSLQAKWDASSRRMIFPISAEVAGVGPMRGVGVAQVGSHGLVQVNCYTRADDFDATMPVFQEWIDGVRIHAGYEWQPGSEAPGDALAVGSAAVVGVLVLIGGGILVVAAVLGALLYGRSRRRRRSQRRPGALPGRPGPEGPRSAVDPGTMPAERRGRGSRTRQLVDINSASAEELCGELGLPWELAVKIVETRASLGSYRHPEQLYSRAGLPYELYMDVVERVTVAAAGH